MALTGHAAEESRPTTTRWRPSDDAALHHGRRDRHRHHPRRRAGPARAAVRPRHRQPEPRHGLAGDEEDAPQPGAVLRRHDPAAAVHRDVRLHLRRRDLRQRRGLPADHHPRHPRPDRADRLHGDRHPAPRGHGQGRLRPVQVAADRPDRARWPARRSPTCCATATAATLTILTGIAMGYRPGGGVARRRSAAGCSPSSPAGRWPGSSPGSAPSPAAPRRCRASR